MAIAEPREALPRTVRVLEEGLASGLHMGAQAYISIGGQVVADFGLGLARPGLPMSADSMMIWFSATKPTAAVCIAQLWEQGKLDLDDPVSRHIPEFGANGKDKITIRHVLTHTGGFRFAALSRDALGRGVGPYFTPWSESIARICAAPLDPDWVPGKKAGYHGITGWFILGELVRRLDGRPFERYVREALFEPLGMVDSWVGVPPERYRAYGDRIGFMHDTAGETPQPLHLDSEEGASHCVPAAGGRGPMRELGRFYEMLLGRGQLDGVRIISPQTVEALTARHRVGMLDHTFQAVFDWGLGFIPDYYAYGRHCSPRAFGHGGARSSIGFADPEHRLAVAVVTNGMAAPKDHQRRFEAIATAIYEDLGLAEPGAPGRDHVLPGSGLV